MQCTYCFKEAVGDNVRTYRQPMGFQGSQLKHPHREASEPNEWGMPTVVTWRNPACEDHGGGLT